MADGDQQTIDTAPTTPAPAPAAAPATAPDAAATPKAQSEDKAPVTPGSMLTGAEPAPAEDAAPDPGVWGDDWREKIAGKDDKALARLKRFGSPGDVFSAYRALETKLASGAKVDPLPEDATPEQIEEYREKLGVPKTAEGYFESMPDGVVLSDADRDLAKTYVEDMHAKNVTPEVVHAGLQWYQDMVAYQVEQQQERDAQQHVEVGKVLREEYGPELASRLNGVKNLLETAPPMTDGTTFTELLDSVRTGDGRKLGDIPEVVKFFADVAYQINPAGFVAPSDGAGQLESVTSELATLRKEMAIPGSAYWKDSSKQERYRALLDAEEKLGRG